MDESKAGAAFYGRQSITAGRFGRHIWRPYPKWWQCHLQRPLSILLRPLPVSVPAALGERIAFIPII